MAACLHISEAYGLSGAIVLEDKLPLVSPGVV